MSDDKGDLLSLDVTEITNVVVRPGGLWREVQVVGETGSTNADLLAQAGAGAAEGVVLVAEAQTAARGRLGRRWTSPPRAALTFSVLLRPRGVPPALLGWVPLLAGVAAASAVRAVTGVEATLKWPNDVLADGGKLGGILAERSGPAVVVGIGINVWQDRAGLPGDGRHVPAAGGPGRRAPRGAGTAAPRRFPGCASGCWRNCSPRCRTGTWPGATRPAPATRTRAGCGGSTPAAAPRSAGRWS